VEAEFKAYCDLVVRCYETTIKRRTAVKSNKCVRCHSDPLVSWERNIYELAKSYLKAGNEYTKILP